MYGKEPNCDACIPMLFPENEEVAKVWFVVSDQVLVGGMGDVIGINNLAIHAAMDLYNVRDKINCLEKIRFAFYRLEEERRLESGKVPSI